jgi:ferric-dicitrate binding protein FerR (iron transport regulator)
MERDVDEEAARLLDRVAGEVPVAPAPVGRLLHAARRRRRRRLLTAVAVVLAVAALLLALV